MTLADDFVEFIELLNKHEVRYMIVGGYALAFHDKPRYTGDIDIWIEVSVHNATKLMRVIKDFGLGGLGFVKEDFLSEGYITQFGRPPLRIDILTSIDGVDFAKAYPHSEMVTIDDLDVRYIGLRDLIKNKEASGRPKDIIDLKEIKGGSKNKRSKK